MTQEDKDLLLKDLCARLPYGVKVEITHWRNRDKGMIDSIRFNVLLEVNKAHILINPTSDVRPYLFPLSSMTKEQKSEFIDTCTLLYYSTFGWTDKTFDWLNKNHFDYRGLIPMGLANDATGLNIY